MHALWKCLLPAGCGIVICTSLAVAGPQGPANLRCPTGYWLMETLCLSDATGDVLQATHAVESLAALEPGCAPGYWRLDRLCLDAATGDVEHADEKAWPASTEPRK